MRIIKSIASRVIPNPLYDRLWRRKNWKYNSNRFEEAIQHFVVEKGIKDPLEVKRYRKKLVKAFIKDNWYPDEYFFFKYDHLSRRGIKDFVPNREASSFWNFMNSREMYLLTCDKDLTYSYFKSFFHRDVVSITKEQQDNKAQDFFRFTEKHSRFIVKPKFGNLGNGVQIIDVKHTESVESLIRILLQEYPEGFIAEELIMQSNELAEFHPSSVNTLRLTTARMCNGEVYLIHRPFIRFGQNGRCMDNGGQGGIIAGIDFETGIIKGAVDERMNHYIVHPDTGKTILGFQIPRWNEAKALALELANILPNLNYCGWDLALTDNGWIMVEANGKGLFIGFQMPTQEGFRDEFEVLKKSCGYDI